MMRIFVFIFIISTLFAGSNIEKKIYYSKKELHKKEKSIKGINTKLAKIAKEIKYTQKELKKIDEKLSLLEKELKEKENFYTESKKRLNDILKNESELIKEQKKLKEQLTLLIAKYFSKTLILENSSVKTYEDILNEEILKALKKSEKNRIEKLSQKYSKTKMLVEDEQKKIEKIKKEIEVLDKKKKELINLKKRKKESLKLLSYKKRKYKEALTTLLKEQKSLRETLNRLQIVKSEKRKPIKANSASKISVKKIGKSYQYTRTLRYRGPKTIPPLDRFSIVKKYGKYIDPIYNIKIFNESIELKPLTPNAKVKNVLNGRVVLAKKTPHLKNVIIIKHRNGLYTIYAHIDKIAPTIKKGKKVKKGYVIGRVNSKLIFEVTKNNYHINPLDLIKVR